MKNTDQITARIEAAERELAEAKRQFAEANKPEVPKYEPMRGGVFMQVIYDGPCVFRAAVGGMFTGGLGPQGRQYVTMEAAQASAGILNWFTHVLNLAAQLNPSGKAGGAVCLELVGGDWMYRSAENDPTQPPRLSLPIFEDRRAACRAADILNAFNGELAGVKCPFI